MYDFFNNATVAGLIVFIVATPMALSIYSRQKQVDRDWELKRDIANSLMELQKKASYVLLILDRIAQTKSRTKNEADEKSLLEGMKEHEIPRLSYTVNEEIPKLFQEIRGILDIYYKDNKNINLQYEKLKKELRSWHDSILFFNFDIFKRVSEQKTLSLKNFQQELTVIINLVWKEPLNFQ